MTFHPLLRRKALNQMLGDFDGDLNQLFNPESDYLKVEACDWLPAIDIKEEASQFVVHADIPGVELKDIDVSVDNQTLIIRGERESEKKEDKKGFVRIERSKGSFARSINLPETANVDGIDASYNQGVLLITIPKQTQRVSRKINVK